MTLTNDKKCDTYVNKRFANFEVLRIIAMLLIVLHHFCYHGVFVHNIQFYGSTISDLNKFLLMLYMPSGKIGVDIFILISGYFLINSRFKLKHFCKIYIQMLFCSLVFLVFAYFYGSHHISGSILNCSLFPIGGNAYWFISAYVVLYMFVDYINKLLLSLSKREFNIFLSIMFIIWSIIPTFVHTKSLFYYAPISWFLFMYSLGAYIKQFDLRLKPKNCIIVFLLCSIVLCLMYSYNILQNNMVPKVYMRDMNDTFVVLISFSIFLFMKDIKIKNTKIISYISSSVFGVYLIHENMIVRPFLWDRIIHANVLIQNSYWGIYAIIISLIVFITFIFADKLLSVIYKPLTGFIISKTDSILKQVEKLSF